MIRTLFAAFVMAISTLVAMAQTPQEWRDSLDRLRRDIADKPYSSDLHLRKAAVNIQLEQWDYAADEYSLVLSHDAKNLAALFYRAFCHNKMRRHDLALADYDAFLREAPRNIEARLGRVNTLLMMHKQREALDEANQTVEMFPDSAMAYASRAAIERDMEAYDVSLYDWDKALSLRPDDPELLLSKADVLLRMGRKAEARGLLDAMTRLGVPRAALRDWYDKAQ